MIKRKAAVAFLFIAGILFLAHAVVPHHHHGNLICFAKSHCTDECPSGNRESSPDDHHHDNDGCEDHCVLKDPAVVSSTQNSAGLKIFEKKVSQSGTEDLLYCLNPENADQPVPRLNFKSLHPKAAFVYTSLSSPSSGLRAPPLV
jgi:hypothetical protein